MTVNSMRKWQAEISRQQVKRLAPYDPIPGRWVGKLGDKNATLQNPNYPPGYVYVRDLHGNLMTMWNQRAPNQPDLFIVYGYDPVEPKLLQVLGQWTTYVQQPVSSIGPHEATHESFGSDAVPVDGPQIRPFLVRARTGLIVRVYPGYLNKSNGTSIFFRGQDLDLTPYKPTIGALWALITVSDDGVVGVSVGSRVGTVEMLSTTAIPAVPDNTKKALAAVTLHAGQIQIIQNKTQNQIADLRWLPSPPASSPSLSSSPPETDITMIALQLGKLRRAFEILSDVSVDDLVPDDDALDEIAEAGIL